MLYATFPGTVHSTALFLYTHAGGKSRRLALHYPARPSAGCAEATRIAEGSRRDTPMIEMMMMMIPAGSGRKLALDELIETPLPPEFAPRCSLLGTGGRVQIIHSLGEQAMSSEMQEASPKRSPVLDRFRTVTTQQDSGGSPSNHRRRQLVVCSRSLPDLRGHPGSSGRSPSRLFRSHPASPTSPSTHDYYSFAGVRQNSALRENSSPRPLGASPLGSSPSRSPVNSSTRSARASLGSSVHSKDSPVRRTSLSIIRGKVSTPCRTTQKSAEQSTVARPGVRFVETSPPQTHPAGDTMDEDSLERPVARGDLARTRSILSGHHVSSSNALFGLGSSSRSLRRTRSASAAGVWVAAGETPPNPGGRATRGCGSWFSRTCAYAVGCWPLTKRILRRSLILGLPPGLFWTALFQLRCHGFGLPLASWAEGCDAKSGSAAANADASADGQETALAAFGFEDAGLTSFLLSIATLYLGYVPPPPPPPPPPTPPPPPPHPHPPRLQP